ncbi:MAG: glycosyltransferase family 4 protein [Acidobacteria bacterium]|nr:glycosyltransferase family 4 protein [Acidobacteriota bacterium]
MNAARRDLEDARKDLEAARRDLRRIRAGRWFRLGERLRRAAGRPATPTGEPGAARQAPDRGASGDVRAAGSPTEPRRPAPAPLPDQAEALVGEIRASAPGVRPILVGYHPAVLRNPYQQMLYSFGTDSGIGILGAERISDLGEVAERVGPEVAVWLHVHWTQGVLRRASSRGGAVNRYQGFVEQLDGLRARGIRIAYTAHDVLPFEFRYPDLEAAVCAAVVDRADLVLAFCSRTPDLVRPYYDIPQGKMRILRHSSYLGVYPTDLSPEQARRELSLDPGNTVLSLVGAIRHYKGLDLLLDAFETASGKDPSLRLLVAGRPGLYPEADELAERCRRNPAVRAHFDALPDDRMQVWYLAADVAVFPYREVLMSGALMTALSFGRPVIAPRMGCVPDLVTPDIGILFEPGVPGDLERALLEAPRLKDPGFRGAALKAAQAYPPRAMAEDFARLIREASA